MFEPDQAVIPNPQPTHMIQKLSGRTLTNICGVGVFIVTADNYIIATTHSEQSHVYPGRKTFSASGTMKWGAFPDPFAEALRKAESELNHLVDVRSLHLIGFGADARKLYFEFSFVERTKSRSVEVLRRCPSSARTFDLQYELGPICDALLENCWEPAAEASLLTLCARKFGADAVVQTLAAKRNMWGAKTKLEEWDYRASRPGLLPDMSVRYPFEQLPEASAGYLDHALEFLGSLEGKTIVEIGSGTGRFTERLLRSARRLVCIDISSRMIARLEARLRAKGLGSDRLEMHCGMAQNVLPLRYSDVVICSLVLIHNVEDAEFERLVSGICESADLLFIFEDITQGRKTSPHTSLRSEQSLIQAFERHGFVVARRDYHDLFSDKIVFLRMERRTSATAT